MKFNLVAVGGTFDHLHAGHKKLLEAAKNSGRRVIIGLCRQNMLKQKPYPQSLESYGRRRQNLCKSNYNHLVPLNNMFGPAATDSKIEAIVCSPLTKHNVEKINQKRQFNKINPLTIIEVPLVMASDGQRLASTRIRQGLIDRNGFYFPSVFRRDLQLPESIRPNLQQPFAATTNNVLPAKHGLITVGDIATASFTYGKIVPDLAIVDLKTRRLPIFASFKATGLKTGLAAKNPAGQINKNAVKQLLNCLRKKLPTLLIDGEEDLLVLPAILLAPLLTTIYYGQPDQGMVKIIVSETTKSKALKFLQQFT